MKILQIGRLNWASQVEKLPEDLEWLFCEPEYIQNFLKLEEEKLLAESMKRMVKHDVFLEKPKIHIHFNAIVITDYLEELQLEPLMNTIEAYSLFCSAELELSSTSSDGIFRRKMLRKLESSRDISSCINFLNQVLFSSQYGAKLKIPEIDINPGFEGIVQRNGHVNTQFTGNFGENFQQLFTYRYNLSSFPVALELWQEFEKIKGNCQIQLEITPMRRGSLYALMDSFTYNEVELKDPIILEPKPEEIGFYVVSIYARGVGSLTFGPLHWRYSRQGLGNLVLGGGRFSDERRQEFFYYFNPGDMKPPLNVYFSGFRPAEGFEGFGMMKAFNSPFMLIADPRLEGGCFYIGTDQYEEKIIEMIRKALDYLGFSSSELILSGISMGSFGAAYYAVDLNPTAVIVGKPFTNLGDTVSGLKLKRPDEFETSADMLLNVTHGLTQMKIDEFNQKLWNKYHNASFKDTQFALGYMKNDDYDGYATQRLTNYLSQKGVHIYSVGYEGRHNDNSQAINKWFKQQFKRILEDQFGR